MDNLESSKLDLIEAAIRCVAKVGYHGASLRMICSEAGLSLGMVRHCFNNKLEMMSAAYQHLSRELLTHTQQCMSQADPDPIQQLEAFIVAGFQKPVFEDDKILFRFALWSLTRSEPEIAAVHNEIYSRYNQNLEQLFVSLAEKENIEVDAKSASLALVSYLDGLWLEWVLKPEKFDVNKMISICLSLVESHIYRKSSVKVR